MLTFGQGSSPARGADPFYADTLAFSADPITAAADQRLLVPLTVTNASVSTWPAGTADSVFAVSRIYSRNGKRVVNGSTGGALGLWTDLGTPEMVPGETRRIGLNVDTYGLKHGTYVISADLVRGPSSDPTYFGKFGNPTPRLTLIVR